MAVGLLSYEVGVWRWPAVHVITDDGWAKGSAVEARIPQRSDRQFHMVTYATTARPNRQEVVEWLRPP